YFIDDYDRQQEINDEFMTRVWYAARRNGLSIPFPTQTSFEYHMPAPATAPPGEGHAEALAKVPVVVPLGPAEMAELSRGAVRQDSGRGGRIVHQGETGDALFLILSGAAVVSIRDGQGEREVARLSRGEFFGEMALLTGEPRTASVTAADDLAVLAIYKEA